MGITKLSGIVFVCLIAVAGFLPIFVQAQTQEEALLSTILKELRDLKRVTINEIQISTKSINNNTINEIDKAEAHLQSQVDLVRTQLMFQLGIGVAVGLIIGTILVQLIYIKLRKIREALELRRLQEKIKPFEDRKAHLEKEIELLNAKKLELQTQSSNPTPIPTPSPTPTAQQQITPDAYKVLMDLISKNPPTSIPDLPPLPIPNRGRSWVKWLILLAIIISVMALAYVLILNGSPAEVITQ